MEFYNEHRAEFEIENPGLAPAELTKMAMKKYKEIYPGKSRGTPSDASKNDDTNKSNGFSAKRKIDTEGDGIAKLARFSFKKQ